MRVVSIGEILWDVIGEKEYLGGAPFNLCAHLAQLGHEVFFVSAVGCDERGRRTLERLKSLSIDTSYVLCTDVAATGISEVSLDQEGKATHCLPRPAAYDHVSLIVEQRNALAKKKIDWICYGTLAQTQARPRALTRQLFNDNPRARRFFDVNLRPRNWSPELVEDLLAQATAVKLNDEEAVVLNEFLGWPAFSLEHFAGLAGERFKLEVVCITRGASGSALWRKGEYVEARGFKVAVADTVGSGDAFSAALLHGINLGWPLKEVGEFSNRVGALVASRPGATPTWSLEEAFRLSERN
jgi:fructokinase